MPKLKIYRSCYLSGSTEVGKYLYGQCSDTVKRVALDLGGNAPFIVFPTADVDAAVQGLMAAKFRNSGQTCVTANRIMVHSSIYQDFVNKFKLETQKLQVSYMIIHFIFIIVFQIELI